jgi:hypothetical protein
MTLLGGGYTCSKCGKYHRTTVICNCNQTVGNDGFEFDQNSTIPPDKKPMKIYPESEVKKAMDLLLSPIRPLKTQVLQHLTPIELPSDEEIEARARGFTDYPYGQAGFIRGTQYMKEQILNQNK